jgi:hypothetical protein
MSGYIVIENPETGEEVEVEYEVSGGYHRQTLYSPAEYPEVEFLDLPSWADECYLAEQVLEQERQYAEEDRAESRMRW